MDEVVVPRRVLTWTEALSNCSSGVHLIRNSFFRREWTRNATGLITQDVVDREDYIWPHYERSKMIVNPRSVVQVGIHYVLEFLDSAAEHCEVGSEDALVNHYRYWKDGRTERVSDGSALRYGEGLRKNVMDTRKALKMDS
jgi:hypothetical protein